MYPISRSASHNYDHDDGDGDRPVQLLSTSVGAIYTSPLNWAPHRTGRFVAAP